MDDSLAGAGGGGGLGGEDDNQQIASAAEAMVQLSGYYGQQTDESMDVDPNYDPSDFLGNLREPREQKPQLTDLNINIGHQYEPMNMYQGAGGEIAVTVTPQDDLNVDRKPQAIHDDLAISDSDEEDTKDLLTIKPEPSSFLQDNNTNPGGMMMMMNSSQASVDQAPQQPLSATNTETAPNNDDDADNDLLWF